MAENDVKNVRLSRTLEEFAPQLLVSAAIEKTGERLEFNTYKAFIDYVMCQDAESKATLESLFGADEVAKWIPETYTPIKGKRFLPYTDADAYRLLKVATEAFVAVNCTALTSFDLEAEADRILSRTDTIDPGNLNEEFEKYLEDVEVTTRIHETRGEPAADGTVTYRGTRTVKTFKLLPYLALIKKKLPDVGIAPLVRPEEVALCYQIVQEKLTNPCMIELIWSYWHEQGMLVQTMNAISRRFQNVRGPEAKDPLAMLEIGYLRPLNNLLWGYVQDEQHRLSLKRRAYEYDHHYGLTLDGTAVPQLRAVDSRSKFLESFHNLLYLASVFYKQDDDTTMKADGFPVLNALKDVHMLLTEGAHNQFGDLPSTARVEMLMQEWLLARPEFRELLPTRESVAYPEPWMERVDAMKRLQGWIDTSVMHFRNLGVYGELVLLSIRFIEWSDIDEPSAAVTWARFWRSKIQGYLYAYRAVTGVDLTASPTETQQAQWRVAQPSELLKQRLQSGSPVPALPSGTRSMPVPSFRERRALRK